MRHAGKTIGYNCETDLAISASPIQTKNVATHLCKLALARFTQLRIENVTWAIFSTIVSAKQHENSLADQIVERLQGIVNGARLVQEWFSVQAAVCAITNTQMAPSTTGQVLG